MRALTIRQPWATLIALGVKTIETRSWRAPQALIGQTIAIHAGKSSAFLMATLKAAARDLDADAIAICNALMHHDMEPIDVPLGAIVATATLAACVPTIDATDPDDYCADMETGFLAVLPKGDLSAWFYADGSDLDGRCVTDQLPYGDFRPGRWAWLLTDVKATTERCPNDCTRFDGNVPGWTRGSSWNWVPCGVCGGAMKCPPIPAKGRQGLWTWQP